MYIALPADVEDLIKRKVAAGEYDSPSDAVIHAIYLLDARDRLKAVQLEELRREIAIGIEQSKRGETKPFTKETVEQIAAEGRKRLAEKAEQLRAEADRMARNARQPIDEIAQAD